MLVQRAPRAELIKLPAPRAQLVREVSPLIVGKRYLATMPYGLEVLATYKGIQSEKARDNIPDRLLITDGRKSVTPTRINRIRCRQDHVGNEIILAKRTRLQEVQQRFRFARFCPFRSLRHAVFTSNRIRSRAEYTGVFLLAWAILWLARRPGHPEGYRRDN
jgi:hypothetical protein